MCVRVCETWSLRLFPTDVIARTLSSPVTSIFPTRNLLCKKRRKKKERHSRSPWPAPGRQSYRTSVIQAKYPPPFDGAVPVERRCSVALRSFAPTWDTSQSFLGRLIVRSVESPGTLFVLPKLSSRIESSFADRSIDRASTSETGTTERLIDSICRLLIAYGEYFN